MADPHVQTPQPGRAEASEDADVRGLPAQSTALVDAVLDARITREALRVYAVIERADLAGKGWSRPSRARIASEARVHYESVRRCTRLLEQAGYIAVSTSAGRATNVYTLLRRGGKPATGCTSATGGTHAVDEGAPVPPLRAPRPVAHTPPKTGGTHATQVNSNGPSADAAASAGREFWRQGVDLLTASGRKESAARAFIGKLCKEADQTAVAEAISACAAASPADPAAWLRATIKDSKTNRRTRQRAGLRPEDFEETDNADADEILGARGSHHG